MINSVTLLGILKERDQNEEAIRYLAVERDYKDSHGHFECDRLPLMYWTRDQKNVLFSLPEESLVVIRGRIETQNKIAIIIVESLNLVLGSGGKIESL